MGRSTQCANALVPILVSSEQGLGKRTFFRSIQHPQLYAQLKAELLRGERCYLTSDEEREIEENNQNYYHLNPEADLFLKYFAVPRADDSYQELTAADIFTHLQRRNPVALRCCNANSFGHTLLLLGVERHHTAKGNLYRVKVV